MNAGKIKSIVLLLVLYVLLPAIGNPSVLTQAKIWVFFVIGVLSTIYQPAFSPSDKGPPGDRGSYLFIVWGLYLLTLAGVLEANYLRYPSSYDWPVLTWVGLGLTVFGLALRSWAVITLGRFFTMHVRIVEGHKVIEDGPYRYVRHPSYTGALFQYPALLLFFGSWWSFLVAAIILPPIYVYRIRIEEQTLVASLGDAYVEYRKRVGGLLPWIG